MHNESRSPAADTLNTADNSTNRSHRTMRWTARIARRRWIAALAALPLFQATGCFPDPIGALNFELQSLINTTVIDAISVIVQNLLRL